MNNKDQLNRKFHAMITFAFKNLPEKYAGNYPAMVCLKEELIKRAGFYRGYTNMRGEKTYFAESVSGVSLNKLENIYDGVWQVISERIAPYAGDEFIEKLMEFKPE